MKQRTRRPGLLEGQSGIAMAVLGLLVSVALSSQCGSGSSGEGGSVLSSLGGEIELAAGNDPERAARLRAILAGEVTERPAALDGLPVSGDATSLRPAGEAVVRPDPELSWADTGAGSYRVVIDNELGVTELESPPLAQTRWQVSKALRRGRAYSWRVEADGATLGEATFLVLPESGLRFYSVASQFYADQPLLLGAIAQDLGLLMDAERLYGEAEDGEVLLRNLELIRGGGD